MEKNIKINIDDFWNEHKHGILYDNISHVWEDIYKREMEAVLSGIPTNGCAFISQEELDTILANEKDYAIQEAEKEEVDSLRLAGIEADKNGNVEEAINYYELCIWKGEHATHDVFSSYAHAYKCLFVDLRKLGRHEEERRHLENFFAYNDRLSDYEKETYTKRLASVKKKIEKTNKTRNL